MDGDLQKYMSERYKKTLVPKQTEPGPVITISRLVGCPAKKIAQRVCELLNEMRVSKGKEPLWKWISKELLYESAKELNIDPANIEYVFNYESRGMFGDILQSHASKYYKSDRRIKKTIAEVIMALACKGHVIIIGRGGVAITRDMERSFHIHLEAPIEWREIMVSQKFDLSMDEARKYALEIDKKRQEFREFFQGKKDDYSLYDLKLNCMTLSVEETSLIIAKAIELRNLY